MTERELRRRYRDLLARRAAAEKELDVARFEIHALIREARDSFTVSDIASILGVSRETAHKWLRLAESR